MTVFSPVAIIISFCSSRIPLCMALGVVPLHLWPVWPFEYHTHSYLILLSYLLICRSSYLQAFRHPGIKLRHSPPRFPRIPALFRPCKQLAPSSAFHPLPPPPLLLVAPQLNLIPVPFRRASHVNPRIRRSIRHLRLGPHWRTRSAPDPLQ